jgi:hypothetical protein
MDGRNKSGHDKLELKTLTATNEKARLIVAVHDGAVAHVTTRLNKYAKSATQGGRLWPAGFCVTLSPTTSSNAPATRQ